MEIMSDIPIENIYYMALYAWNKIKNKDYIASRGLEHINNINDVLVDLFLLEVGRISKKGLYGQYIDKDHDTEYIRGKINIRESIYLIDPKMNCRYDDFSRNNRINQILKAILNRLYFTKDMSSDFKKRARALLLEFHEIDNISLGESHFKGVTYNRLNQDYCFPIEVGYLIYRNSIPTEEGHVSSFIAINKDQERMSAIFEAFLKNFYKVHTDYEIRSRRYSWDLEALGGSDINLIPRMETDIEIERPDEKIIIDAKYYTNAFTSRHDVRKFISSHMYQMTAYLRRNMSEDESRQLRGILIYPSNGYEFYERFRSREGYTIEFKSINLNKKWEKIGEDLLSVFTGD